MSKSHIHPGKKKKHVRRVLQSPFPVPISSITGTECDRQSWYQFTGELKGDNVIVRHSGDIAYLHSMGFFGQGLMSRGEPAVYDTLPSACLPTQSADKPRRVKVMRRRMYLRHMKWRKSQCQAESLGEDTQPGSDSKVDQEFDSDLEYYPQDIDQNGEAANKTDKPSLDIPAHLPNLEETTESIQKRSIQDSMNDHIDSGKNATGSLFNDVVDNKCFSNLLNMNSDTNQNSEKQLIWSLNSVNQNADQNVWNSNSANEDTTVKDSWDTMEADVDFWTSDVDSVKRNMIETSDTNSTNDAMNNLTAEHHKSVRTIEDNLINKSSDSHKIIEESDIEGKKSTNLEGIPAKRMKLDVEPERLNKKYIAESGYHIPHSEDLTTVCEKIGTEVLEKNVHLNTNETKHDTMMNAHDTEMNVEYKVESEKMLDVSRQKTVNLEETDSNISMSDELNVSSEKRPDELEEKTDNLKESDPNILPLHPYCEQGPELDHSEDDMDEDEDSNHDVLVIDDSDIDDSTVLVEKKERYRWRPVERPDSFRFNEPLVLSLEEAFFLMYGLGCLTVQTENQPEIKIAAFWRKMCERQGRFLPHYVAYHYFRSKGWVPRSGLLFGTDFVLYRVGPPFFHATYSVIVKTVHAGSYEEVEGYRNRDFTWTSLTGLDRVTENVAKVLMFCYVILPSDWQQEDGQSPECLHRITVRLQTVNRWVSSQERGDSNTSAPVL
ncbi:tRNA-splicing endonuclease subunit Sen2-like isoform X2 [Mya arenaria]|uniref:tRNA-splicing endonuclease subunit Sen2-like isoform X2 n=1 Tax=Mya arenaria TaxID=6604 RepID=UPI0022E8662A|nr:tRNA-splicing endonuclease subunit Sen2-like isoform X2 [Mya arenaria]